MTRSSSAHPPHLIMRGTTWHAVLEIPKDARSTLRKRRFMQTLRTDSKTVAQRRAGPVVAAWRSEIERARENPGTDDATFWRRALRSARTEKEREIVTNEIDLAAWSFGDGNSNDPAAVQFRKDVMAVKFTEYVKEWIDTLSAAPRTKAMFKSDVLRFAEGFATVQDVTRPTVRRWAAALAKEGLSRATINRKLGAVRSYWRYLQSVNVAGEEDEPFTKLNLGRDNGTARPKRKPFEPADVVRLLSEAAARGEDARRRRAHGDAASADEALADVIKLAMYTGARINELCELKVGDVADDHFTIRAAKTRAGVRDVPIHAELRQTMARLTEGKKPSDYVLSGLTNDARGYRANGVVQSFGRLKRKLGFGPEVVFHSIRKTVVTILENAGVPENVVADIVGHEKPRITYGLYSGGTSLAVKAEALAKLKYPL